MPTIIRPNRTAKAPVSSAASNSSTHLKALEKIIIPATSSESSSHSATELLDLDTSDYSPPEPTIPPPAPPSFLLDSPPAANAESTVPYALALYDYASSHPGDLNFKVTSASCVAALPRGLPVLIAGSRAKEERTPFIKRMMNLAIETLIDRSRNVRADPKFASCPKFTTRSR